MKKQEVKDFYVQCDCGSEHVFITLQDPNEIEDGVYIAILTNQFNPYSFWNRFRHIWYTLIHGVPYTDQVCLDFDKVKRLNRYLTNYISMTDMVTKCKKQNKKGVK